MRRIITLLVFFAFAGFIPRETLCAAGGMKSGGKKLSIELTEIQREPGKEATVVAYGLRWKGANTGWKYDLFIMVNVAMEEPLQVERFTHKGGRWLGEKQKKDFEDYRLGATGFQKGLKLTATIKEVRGHQEATASVIPFPLEGRDGHCFVGLELMNEDGTQFTLYGGGFVPGEKVNFKDISGAEVIDGTYRIDDNGFLPPVIMFPGNVALEYSARIEVKGVRCAPGFDYQWGPPAMSKQ